MEWKLMEKLILKGVFCQLEKQIGVIFKKIFKVLEKQIPGKNGEIHITDSIKTLIQQKNKFIGHIFAGKYLDCGSMQGYINSTLEISKL